MRRGGLRLGAYQGRLYEERLRTKPYSTPGKSQRVRNPQPRRRGAAGIRSPG